MTNRTSDVKSFVDLAAYLLVRRETILNRWRMSCEADTTVTIGRSLSREEFNDMMPRILHTLNQQLQGEVEEADPSQQAAEHGLHRWQNGYSLLELLREIRYLHQCLMEEMQLYLELYPDVESQYLRKGYEAIVGLIQATTEGSVAKYADLDKTQARGRAQALEQALKQVNDLAQQRSDLLRTSSHDLRSSFGVVQSAAFLLDLDGQSPDQREKLREMLNRNLTNVQHLLMQLTDMARLEAGQEPLEVKEFDAAQLIQEVITSAKSLASQRQLVLLADGPERLMVKSDPVKIHRILQNLLMNALNYTESGMVSVTWIRENNFRWLLSVQDTGPGLPVDLASGLFDQLKPTIETSAILVRDDDPGNLDSGREFPKKVQGEGIGLRIVKQVCELLGATMDIESRSGTGSLFRIRFPIYYDGL